MHEARSKDELYRKIYHEPEGNIGVLRVKLMYSLFFIIRESNKVYYERESKGIVAWKARWASRLLASEANVKTIGREKR